MASNDRRQYPLQKRMVEEAFKRFFNPKKAPFGIAVGVAALALLSSVAAMIAGRYKRRRKLFSRTISLPSTLSSVEVGSGIRLQLSFGTEQSLVVSARKRMIDRVICDVRGTRLRLYIVLDMRHSRNQPVDITLSVEALSAISLAGDSVILADGVNVVHEFTLKQHNSELAGLNVEAARSTLKMTGAYACDIAFLKGVLHAEMMGSGFATLAVEATDIDTRLAGECICLMSGNAKYLSCHASGYCEMNAKGFAVEKAFITLIESAACEIYCAETVDLSLFDRSRLVLNSSPRNKGRVRVQDNAELVYVERPAVSHGMQEL